MPAARRPLLVLLAALTAGTGLTWADPPAPPDPAGTGAAVLRHAELAVRAAARRVEAHTAGCTVTDQNVVLDGPAAVPVTPAPLTTSYLWTVTVTSTVSGTCPPGVQAAVRIFDTSPLPGQPPYQTKLITRTNLTARSVTTTATLDVPYFTASAARVVAQLVVHIEAYNNDRNGAGAVLERYYCRDRRYHVIAASRTGPVVIEDEPLPFALTELRAAADAGKANVCAGSS